MENREEQGRVRISYDTFSFIWYKAYKNSIQQDRCITDTNNITKDETTTVKLGIS